MTNYSPNSLEKVSPGLESYTEEQEMYQRPTQSMDMGFRASSNKVKRLSMTPVQDDPGQLQPYDCAGSGAFAKANRGSRLPVHQLNKKKLCHSMTTYLTAMRRSLATTRNFT